MSSNQYFLWFRKNFDTLLFAIAAWWMIFLFTRHGGIGLSPDSLTYITTAKNLVSNGTLKACNAMPMTDFPAFYPIFLSIILFITKQSPVAFGVALNGFLFAGTVILAGYIIPRFLTPSRLYKNILLLCIVCSPTLIEVYYMLWSETLFIFLSLLFFILFKQYLRSYKLAQLLYAAAVVSIACDTRYAGVTLIGTGCMLILFDKNLAFTKKLLHIPVFFITGALLLFINLLHNYLATNLFTGNREKGITPLIDNIKHCGTVFCDWLPFFNGNYTLSAIVPVVVFILACVFFLKHIFYATEYSSYENIGLAFLITYAVFIVASATLTHYETLNSRLLSPMYIPFLWSITYWIVPVVKQRKPVVKWILLSASMALSFFFVWNEYNQSYDLYDDATTNGIPGYSDDSWTASPIVIYLNQHTNMFSQSSLLYSNDISAVAFYTGCACEPLPHYVFKEEIADYKTEDPHYLIWFENSDDAELYHLPDVMKLRTLTLIKNFADGNIYWSCPLGNVKH